ncbi:MAG: PEP-CTERM sorting domain-containing protein [Tepidisphaeraceae bacterium]
MFGTSRMRVAAVGCAFALGVWTFSGGTASAVVLNPGDSSTALTGTDSVAGDTYQTTETRMFSGTGTHGVPFDFTLVTNVYTEASGSVDFTYQLTNTGGAGANSFDRMTLGSFLGYSVDADYQAGTGVTPGEVDRNVSGATVGYDFATTYTYDGSTPVGPGEETDLMIVKTDSSTWTMGSATVIDSASDSVSTEVPFGVVVVPEPGSLAIIALSLGLLARRRPSAR